MLSLCCGCVKMADCVGFFLYTSLLLNRQRLRGAVKWNLELRICDVTMDRELSKLQTLSFSRRNTLPTASNGADLRSDLRPQVTFYIICGSRYGCCSSLLGTEFGHRGRRARHLMRGLLYCLCCLKTLLLSVCFRMYGNTNRTSNLTLTNSHVAALS